MTKKKKKKKKKRRCPIHAELNFSKQQLFYLLIAHIPTFRDYMCITKEYMFIGHMKDSFNCNYPDYHMWFLVISQF